MVVASEKITTSIASNGISGRGKYTKMRGEKEQMAKWQKVKDVKRGGKKIGVMLENPSNHNVVTLLNPHGKYQKYAQELEKGIKLTNEGSIKRDANGKAIPLTAADKKYRQGYNSALIDQSKIFNGGKK